MTIFNEKEYLIGTAEYGANFWNAMRGIQHAYDKIHGGANGIINQELLCRGWFLPPNTYDCGSFVVNGTAVVGKEKKSPYNHWKSTQKGADLYEINI